MKTRRLLITNQYYDRTGIVRKLEDLALKGWRLREIGSLTWKFERIPAQALRYAVTYFPELSTFDTGLSEERRRFLEYCEAAGWQLCGSNGQLQVFCNEDPEAVDLETEPGPELENIHRTAKKVWLWPMALLLFSGLLNLFTRLSSLARWPLYSLPDPSWLLSLGSALVLIVLAAGELLAYFLWRRKALKNAEEGRFTPTPSTKWLQNGCLLTAALLLAGQMAAVNMRWRAVWLICLLPGIGTFAICIFLRWFLRKKQVPAGKAGAAYWIIALVLGLLFYGIGIKVGMDVLSDTPEPPSEEPPVTLADLLGATEGEYRRDGDTSGTFLLAVRRYRDRPVKNEPGQPGLEYTVLDVKLPLLYDRCKYSDRESLIAWQGLTNDMTPADPAPWGAEEVWVKDGDYLVCWENKLARISCRNFTPTEEQIKIIALALQ